MTARQPTPSSQGRSYSPLLVRKVSMAGWPSPAALLATISTSQRLDGSSSVKWSSFSLPGTRTVCQLPTMPTLSSNYSGENKALKKKKKRWGEIRARKTSIPTALKVEVIQFQMNSESDTPSKVKENTLFKTQKET